MRIHASGGQDSKRRGRTIIVSNRLPVQASATEHGIDLTPSSGGLVRGLVGVHEAGESIWIGSLGTPADGAVAPGEVDRLEQEGFHVVDVAADLYEAYYEGFSNGALWPLFHYAPEHCRFSSETWAAYRRVNEVFAAAVERTLGEGDQVWIHDYQLMLLPELLRRRRRDLSIGFFLHTPFPSAELFRILPWRREILTGLLGADLVGFHTLEYMRHFAQAVARVIGVEPQLDTIRHAGRQVRLGAFPLGIAVRELHEEAHSAKVEHALADLDGLYTGRKMILGVDRLDYTKGIPERLTAFRSFLELHPEWVGKVSLVLVSVPSRVNVAGYQELKRKVDELVGTINGERGSPGYSPVEYVFRSMEKADLLALYRRADVALITPIRDGLNLVCKEFVACKGDDPGVLVLSEFAGAAAEMGDAILVNPWSVDGMVAGIRSALTLPESKARRMMSNLWERLSRYDDREWSRSFLGALRDAVEVNREGAVTIHEPDIEDLSRRVARARRVFLFLDYDGTLVPIAEKPELALPTPEILSLLGKLAEVERFHVAVVSGRDQRFLESLLPANVTLVSEHGASIRMANEEELVRLVDQTACGELRDSVRAIMRDFEHRIPGSFIEEKELGVVWHYRMADPIFAYQQALALADTLGGLLRQTPFGVLMSKKAVEVRHQSANKGEALRAILARAGFDPEADVLITVGDDRTDEDMFRVLPEHNISINVGDEPMAASYVMERGALLELLAKLARVAGRGGSQHAGHA